jgi:hypothetical protein
MSLKSREGGFSSQTTMDPSRATPLVASASAPDPQALMAAYPFASSTPSAHGKSGIRDFLLVISPPLSFSPS